MKVLQQRDSSFVLALKSAAGFAFAATAIVGMLLALAGSDPEKVQWLLYSSAVAGAVAGAVFGSSGSRE